MTVSIWISYKVRKKWYLTVNKRNIIYMIALVCVTVLVTSFIFYNAVTDYDKSHDTSDAVANIILPNAQEADPQSLVSVRKIAHLVEYAILGIAVMLLASFVCKGLGKSIYGTAFFYVLAVAVIDEHIQSFSDRTSATKDIILDFCGALIGFFIVYLTVVTVSFFKKRKTEVKNDE